MDRQHPRDLFDVLGLFEEGGLSTGVVECFVCYLAGHNRPVHEVLFANEVDITLPFTSDFEGMTRDPVSLDDLLEVRRRLFAELPAALPEKHLNHCRQERPDSSLTKLPRVPVDLWRSPAASLA